MLDVKEEGVYLNCSLCKRQEACYIQECLANMLKIMRLALLVMDEKADEIVDTAEMEDTLKRNIATHCRSFEDATVISNHSK